MNVNVISGEFDDVMDLYVNRDGLHIIVQRANQLDYYLFSPTGSQIRSSIIDNNVNENQRLSKIIGYEENVYIVYKENNRIKIRLSTDAGATWSANISEIVMTYPYSKGLNLWTDANGLHLVYSEASWAYSEPYDTWYQRLRHGETFWIETYKVTDNPNDAGGVPAVTTSPDRVHVVFTDIRAPNPLTTEPGDARTRDRYLGSWQSSIDLFENDAVLGNIVASSSKLHGVYDVLIDLHFNLYYKNRDFSSPWPSQSSLLLQLSEPFFAPADMAVTEDDRVHITTGYESYVEWANGTLSPPFRYAYRGFTSWSRIDANGNDVYVAWLNQDVTPNTIEMRQRDFPPLAPQNLTSYLDSNPPCGSCHTTEYSVDLDWDENIEADLSHYIIYRAEFPGSCTSCHQSSNNSPEDSLSDPEYLNETITLEQDCPALSGELPEFTKLKLEVETGCQSGLESTEKLTFEPIWAWANNWWIDIQIQKNYTYTYFVSAVDAISGQESDPSNFTITYVPEGGFTKPPSKPLSNFPDEVVPRIFFLYQNYPNPFNQTTTIRYQVPEDTQVLIEIFDVLGRKVNTLVNAFRTSGYYSISWNGEDNFGQSLSSGIYIYNMKAGEFTLTRKMILLR